jgi:chaperonin GroEL (HSP60 family)
LVAWLGLIRLPRSSKSFPARRVSVVVGKILESKSQTFGYDARTEQFIDMVSAGVVDPAKLARVAFRDAASVAGLLITLTQ